MGPRLPILTLLAACLFFHASAKETLSKEEAGKQIGQFYQTELFSGFYLDAYVYETHIPENITALKKAGFIKLAPNNTKHGTLLVKTTAKSQPYFIKEENGKLYFKMGTFPLEVVYISDPSSESGNIVCRVQYKEIIKLNALGKAWNPHCLKDGTCINTAKFIKTQSGWKIIEGW